MLAVAFLAKCIDDSIKALWRMLDAINQIVGVLAFEALVERECFQAGETY